MTPRDMAETHAAAFTQSRAWSAAEFTDLLTNKFTHTVGVAESFAVFQVVADSAELLTIATHPSHQRQGLAQSIMAKWHAQAHKLGATNAVLDVAADNKPAISLYERCGYIRCGTRQAYYLRENAPNMDAVVMRRSLP